MFGNCYGGFLPMINSNRKLYHNTLSSEKDCYNY